MTAADRHPDDVPADEMALLDFATQCGLTMAPWQRQYATAILPPITERSSCCGADMTRWDGRDWCCACLSLVASGEDRP